MTDRLRRSDDPKDFHGPDFRADQPMFRLGYKEASLSVYGLGVFVVLAVLAIVGSNFYAGRLITDAIYSTHAIAMADHKHLKISADRTSCQVNLSFKERRIFRENYSIGSFKRWCPWVDE